MQLAELRPGASFRVGKVLVGGEIGKRLADMGFTEGAEGELIRSAFMRGPVQIRIRGYDLLVRRSEARLIEVAAAGGGGNQTGQDRIDQDGGALQTGQDGIGRDGGYRPRRGRGFGFRALFAPQDCCGGRGGFHGGRNGGRDQTNQTGRDRIGRDGGAPQTGRDGIRKDGGASQTGHDRIGKNDLQERAE
jgi:ferrous iron transport protein A